MAEQMEKIQAALLNATQIVWTIKCWQISAVGPHNQIIMVALFDGKAAFNKHKNRSTKTNTKR